MPERAQNKNILDGLPNLEPIPAPFALHLSSRYVQFSHSQTEILELILDGSTKKQIAQKRGLAPGTIDSEFRQLYQNVEKILDSSPENGLSRLLVVSTLLRAGAIVQTPTNQEVKQEESNGGHRSFKIKIQRIGNRYIFPYRLAISKADLDLTEKQRMAIRQMLSNKTTLEEMANSSGVSRNAVKKRIGATEKTQRSLRNLVIELTGNNNQKLSSLKILLKLFEYGILRQIPVEFGPVMLDNNSQDDRL